MTRTFKDKVNLTLQNEIISEPLSFIQCKQVSLLNCIFISAATEAKVAITLNACEDVIIRHCKFSDTNPIYAYKSKDLVIEKNEAFDITAAKPRGQFFQANACKGPITIINNTMTNTGKKVMVEDFINLYKTYGTKEDPCLVVNNSIYGNHGTSATGGGIMLGDNGGAWQEARNNLLVNAGQYGVAVAGGANMVIKGNRVYGSRSPISNVGIYVWAQKSAPLSEILVSDNKVDYTTKQGVKNPFWLGGDAKNVTTVRGNDFEWVYTDIKQEEEERKESEPDDLRVSIEKKALCHYESGVCVRIDFL